MLKLFFLFLAFFVNFVIYVAPLFVTTMVRRRYGHPRSSLINLQYKNDKLLFFLPFIVWIALYLFDPDQKTVRQLIFPDPFIIGFIGTLLLIAREKIFDALNRTTTTLLMTAFMSLVTIIIWFSFPAVI